MKQMNLGGIHDTEEPGKDIYQEVSSLIEEDNDLPPWDVDDTPPPSDKDDPYAGSSMGEISFGDLSDAPGVAQTVIKTADEIRQENAGGNLEIIRKADRFDSLHLFSGNSVEGGVTEAYVREHYGNMGVKQYKMAKFLLPTLGYTVSPDVLLMLSSTKSARIVVATAGAGKTTSLQLDLVIRKIIDNALGENKLAPELIEGTTVSVPRILYLNYNKHNVNMITQRHVAMCKAVNEVFDGPPISDAIESTTVHAFCYRWLSSLSGSLNLPELKIITDEQKEKVWTAIIEPRWVKFYGEDNSSVVSFEQMDELYTYKTESMLDWDEFFETAKFVDSGLLPDFAKACIKKYDAMKSQMGLLDFTDYLVLMTTVLREHSDIRERLQKRYTAVIADENQDFTRLMNELLLQLYAPGVNTLTVVGDPDQTIYSFKGVSPDNVVTLYEDLQDVELLGLDTNYRCPDTVVNAAKAILDLNVLRFKKPIGTVRTGGKLQTHPLLGNQDQSAEVISLLNRIGQPNWQDTVISYRNNSSAIIMAEELYYAGIPFSVLDDQRPFNNVVFKHLMSCIRALHEKDNMDLNKGLYRFIPMSREDWWKLVDKNYNNRHMHFHDFEFSGSYPSGTREAIKVLYEVSLMTATHPTSDYIMELVRLYRRYYFDFIASPSVNQPSVGRGGKKKSDLFVYLDRAIKFFNRPHTYDYLCQELAERNKDRADGVSFSTFHGLKGLEFDYVIAIDFNDTLFPNYYDIEQRYSSNTALMEKEAENRLCYVLVTRAKKEFHMFYSDTDPSVYVGLLMNAAYPSANKAKALEMPEVSLGTVASFNSDSTAQDSFIKRLLGKG